MKCGRESSRHFGRQLKRPDCRKCWAGNAILQVVDGWQNATAAKCQHCQPIWQDAQSNLRICLIAFFLYVKLCHPISPKIYLIPWMDLNNTVPWAHDSPPQMASRSSWPFFQNSLLLLTDGWTNWQNVHGTWPISFSIILLIAPTFSQT